MNMNIIIFAKIFIIFLIIITSCTLSSENMSNSEFLISTYNLTVNITGNGNVKINPMKLIYRQGNIITLEATCDADNVFVQWTGDQLGDSNPITITMDSNKIINARFVNKSSPKYMLNLSNTGYGNIVVIPQKSEFYEDTEVMLFPAAATGYCFDHWDGNLTGNIKPAVITMNENKTVTAIFTKNYWTIMIYMDGDNNLEPFAIQDFNEMEAINLSETGINVLVLVDRSPYYDTSNGNWSNTRLYKINYDPTGLNSNIVSECLSSYELGLTKDDNEELNMGDPKTVSNFIDFCKKNYYAQNYMLVFWNHGKGWRSESQLVLNNNQNNFNIQQNMSDNSPNNRNICVDDSANDFLYTKEIEEGITGKGLDIIGFDLCYGAMFEIAYQIRNEASYMIASQDSEPGDGWEYNLVLNNFVESSKSKLDMLNAVIDAYKTNYINYSAVTISAINLTKLETVMNEFNKFSLKLYSECTNDEIRMNVRDVFFREIDFCYTSGSYPQDMNIDIWHAAFQINSKFTYANIEAQSVMNAVSNAIINEWHDSSVHSNAHGLSIHFAPVDYFKNFDKNGYNPAYWKNFTGFYPLSFVNNSDWVPEKISETEGKGLLYRLWYEELPNSPF
jgi:hypothetical protein